MTHNQALWPVLAALLVMSPAGCGGAAREKTTARGIDVERLPKLEVVQAQTNTPLIVRRSYTATVEAYEKAELAARVRGQVNFLTANADIGRRVKKDEPLIILDIPEITAEQEHKKALLEQANNQHEQTLHALKVAREEVNEARAQEKKYDAEVKFRELQYARYVKLAQGDTVSQQLADEAKLQHSSAQAALHALHAQILTKEARLQAAQVEIKVADSKKKVAQAELDRLGALVSFATIRAPFDGSITKRWVDRGAIVKDSGTPLLTVMGTDTVRVLFDVPERDVPYIHPDRPGKPGNPVELHIPALQEILPEHQYKGTMTLTASALDPVTRTMRTELHLGNSDGYLKPQMTGIAMVILAQRMATTIQSTALVRRGDKTLIYFLANPSGDPPQGVVKPLEVQLGLDDGLRVEILNPRLTGQELIIRKGTGVIHAGDQAIAVPARREELQ